MMTTDAATLTKALRGKWHGRYGLAYCPGHRNTRTPALSLANGDGGQLLAYCHAGCDFTAIMGSLRGLGLLNNDLIRTAPIEAGLTRRRANERAQAQKQAQAHLLWNKTRPIVSTVAEVYLRSRGITCQLPGTLRFAPSCRHTTDQHLPAMVALVEGSDSVAVHRTFLCADGSGSRSRTAF